MTLKVKIYITAVVLGLIVPVFDDIFNAFILPDETLWKLLVTEVTTFEYINRFIILGLILSSAVIITKILDKRQAITNELKESEKKHKDLNATKDKFFSIIAHDLRNPLASFISVTQYLDENYQIISEEDRIEFISLIRKSSQNLYSLLENLLTWSQSQRGTINYNPGLNDLSYVIDGITDQLATQAKNKNISIISRINEVTICHFDVNMISTILRNLISNAIKFTPQNGNITIYLAESDISHSNMDSDKFITVAVKDTGVGMTKESMSKLFSVESAQSQHWEPTRSKAPGWDLLSVRNSYKSTMEKSGLKANRGKGRLFILLYFETLRLTYKFFIKSFKSPCFTYLFISIFLNFIRIFVGF